MVLGKHFFRVEIKKKREKYSLIYLGNRNGLLILFKKLLDNKLKSNSSNGFGQKSYGKLMRNKVKIKNQQ
jgi:hypothetical protein